MAGNDNGNNFASDCLGQFGANGSSGCCLSRDNRYGGDDNDYDNEYPMSNDYSEDDKKENKKDDRKDDKKDDKKDPMRRLKFNAEDTEIYIVLVAGYDGSEGGFELSAEGSDTSNNPTSSPK